VTSTIEVKDSDEYLFEGVPNMFQGTHYHSWAVRADSIKPELKVTAVNDEGLVMGLRHTKYDVKGLQFHPESIMTPEGPKMIANWLKH
jgi:anthranilate synthase component II